MNFEFIFLFHKLNYNIFLTLEYGCIIVTTETDMEIKNPQIIVSSTVETQSQEKNSKEQIKRILRKSNMLRHLNRESKYCLQMLKWQSKRASYESDLKLPSARLIYLVSGTPDPEWFVRSGKETAKNIFESLHRNNINFSEFKNILDFGCGCGRLIRHLLPLSPANYYGTDYNLKLVNWCKNNLKGNFRTNDVAPPIPYRDGQFDFVYAYSVFTHFHENMQLTWLNELGRVLKPKGYLWFSFSGRNHTKELAPNELKKFYQDDIVVHEGKEGSNWCCAYYSANYLKQLVEKNGLFEVVEIAALNKPYAQEHCLLQRNSSFLAR
jgi:SAM-dependent methyltransferase